jgi:hypothetical protein
MAIVPAGLPFGRSFSSPIRCGICSADRFSELTGYAEWQP